jgi:hypothetical protein
MRAVLAHGDLDRACRHDQVLARARRVRFGVLAVMRGKAQFVELDLALAVEREQGARGELSIA